MKYFLLLAFALLATPALAQPAYPSFTPETSLSATGTTQATAAPVKTPFVYATISAGNVGVILTNVTQTTVCDASNGAAQLLVYPPVGSSLGSSAVNAPLPLNWGECGVFSNAGGGTTFDGAIALLNPMVF